jgi:hypothetical protein
MKTLASFSSTVAFLPGRKLARTRMATGPSRRSMLAGWIWALGEGLVGWISRFWAISRFSTWLGRMPVEKRP